MTNPYWVIAQCGILLEIFGALYIFVASISAHRQIERIFRGLDGWKEIPKLVATIQHQTRTDITGFALLGSGLIMQFIGGFGTL
ncbi:MAG: hypothetical protein QNJ73_01130 [Gammaproteobacteria bacterium]|nr:hypothetical protein [Gammaproteobacteria bacterium]